MSADLDAVNLTLGIFGVLALIPIITKFIKSKLPSAQLSYFDKLVTETESLILSLEEQGTFREPITTAHFRKRLSRRLSFHECEPRKETATEELNRVNDASTSSDDNEAFDVVSPLTGAGTIGSIAVSDSDQSEHSSAIVSPSAEQSGSSASSTTTDTGIPVPVTSSPSCKLLTSPSGTPHLGDPVHIDVPRRPKTRHQSPQYIRRSKRYLAARRLSSLTTAQMGHRKSGVMRSDDFKRVLRSGTSDSNLSSSTCVSESDSLPTHGKLPYNQSVREHEDTGIGRMWNLIRLGRMSLSETQGLDITSVRH
ncbi:hypothetical protein C8Q80DRAFT_1276552 [Daedaleopsis nitida]|nr:hypothetical protein C8Q80DRAFT_1276552 [Daedaleopsis nitida]